MKCLALTTALTLTLNLLAPVPTLCAPAHTSHTSRPVEPIIIRALICAYALKHNVEPAAAMAVARIESGKGKIEFRSGLMGKTYYGPFGIHRCFLKKWPIDQLECNIEVGVKALARHKDLKVSLKKYNKAFDSNYWQSITRARNEYKKKGVSG